LIKCGDQHRDCSECQGLLVLYHFLSWIDLVFNFRNQWDPICCQMAMYLKREHKLSFYWVPIITSWSFLYFIQSYGTDYAIISKRWNALPISWKQWRFKAHHVWIVFRKHLCYVWFICFVQSFCSRCDYKSSYFEVAWDLSVNKAVPFVLADGL